MDHSETTEEPITKLLAAAQAGDRAANERLFGAVYQHLRKLAKSQRRRWQGNETMGTTALINEAFIKLATPMDFECRAHFFATASKAMRQILVTYAERQRTARRGGDRLRVTLDDASLRSEMSAAEVLDLERAVTELEATDARRGRIVECRLFGGMTVQETAAALEISPATVKREWRVASAWLTRALTVGSED